MSEKLCVFCKNLETDTSGCRDEYPDPVEFTCKKGRWRSGIEWWQGLKDFRTKILEAEDCSDYDEAKA